jgi:hypothetical protein
VLRLSPSLAVLRLQQGYITCQPKPDVRAGRGAACLL